ncbi:MAG TPA: hypothetical protein VNJ12_00345 [Candidatus Dormibacteraeota bacterium]|nr:hypothetical protein [Candidatus Dormibacteraeota bacterium]
MNRAFAIIGVPAVGVSAFYAAILWGRWVATIVAIGLTVLLAVVAKVDSRRRRAASQLASGQDQTPLGR